MLAALSRASCVAALARVAPAPTLLAAPSILRRYHENVVDHYESPRNVGAWGTGGPWNDRGTFALRERACNSLPAFPRPPGPRATPAPFCTPGSLPKDDPNVGTGFVGAPACGDVMKMQVGTAH